MPSSGWCSPIPDTSDMKTAIKSHPLASHNPESKENKFYLTLYQGFQLIPRPQVSALIGFLFTTFLISYGINQCLNGLYFMSLMS